jgi:hypothetical protein
MAQCPLGVRVTPQLAGEMDLRAGDTRPRSSLGLPADHSSAAVPTSPNKESAFGSMAGRIGWELRLDELRRTTELSHARTTA